MKHVTRDENPTCGALEFTDSRAGVIKYRGAV
jgi:hypothetical protein